jgi:hypothetical protein
MTGPQMDRLASAHIVELRHQATQERLARQVPPARHSENHAVRRRLKLRLGAYLVGMGQRLLISSTPNSNLA